MIYRTFQQLPPKQQGDEWIAHLVQRYDVEAKDERAAIRQAMEWDFFRRGKGLGRFPIVEEVSNVN